MIPLYPDVCWFLLYPFLFVDTHILPLPQKMCRPIIWQPAAPLSIYRAHSSDKLNEGSKIGCSENEESTMSQGENHDFPIWLSNYIATTISKGAMAM